MTKVLALAVLLLSSRPAPAQIRGVELGGGAGESGGVSAAALSRPLFSAQANQLITVLQGAGLGTPNAAPIVALDASRALAAAVQASPASLAVPAQEILAALARPEGVAALEAKLDAPTYERLTALHAEVRRQPEVFAVITEVFKKTEGDKPFDRALLDAVFDNSKAGEDSATPVLGAESKSVATLSKPTAEKSTGGHDLPPPPDSKVLKKAGIQVAGWVAAAMAFGAGLHHFLGAQAFSEYLTTYVIEWSMSLDNLVVISAALLAMPESVRGKALRWGLIGTIAARLLMVTGGVGLVASVHGVFTAFGLFLIATALKMISPKLDAFALIAKLYRKIAPKGSGRFAAALSRLVPKSLQTPLALGVMTVVGYGVIFALDSVPASLAISKSWFVIFSANAFSVMGLGALFSVIAWLNSRFEHLPKGVAAVLAFVGGKMLIEPLLGVTLGSGLSLAVIGVLLGGSALWSLVSARRKA